ncbi:MAG TPA: MFS transporter [Micromonosporaceae bacterium]|nr:MFS transporter [Micromonosporaceae bacterium]
MIDERVAPSLVRDRDFVLFWSGQAVSLTGSAVTRVALPLLAVLTLEASPLGLGVLGACVWLPFVGLPMLAGAYVDRHRKRPILLGCNAIRAVLLGLVPVLWALDALTLPILCAIALVSGVCEVVFQVAELAYLPAFVGRDRLLQANSGIESARAGADLGGTGIAGLLVQALGPPLAVLADAASYVVSTLTLGAIRRREPVPDRATRRHLGREIVEGLEFVWRTRTLRTIAFALMLTNLAWQAFSTAFVLYAIRDRGVGSGWWGLVLAIGGGTAMMAALVAPRLATRYGYGPVIVTAGLFTMGPILLIPAIEGPLWMVVGGWAVAMALSGLGAGVLNVLSTTLRAKLSPDELLGRIGATTRQLVFAGIPVGALLGGVLAEAFGARSSIWISAGAAVAFMLLLLPLRRIRDPGSASTGGGL